MPDEAVPDEAVARQLWVDRVLFLAREIDPNDEHDWSSLCLGFLLGLGYFPERCHQLIATFAREGLL